MTTTEPAAPSPVTPSFVVPRRRRRRWPFVVLAVVLVVVIVGLVLADAAAKAYASDRIRSELVSALGLPAPTEVDVDLGSGSLLLQALGGSVSTVDVSIPKLAFGDLVGAGSIHATKVPIDTSRPLATLHVDYAVTEKDLAAIAKNLSGLDVTTVTLEKSEIVAAGDVTVLGAAVPVSLGLTPSVSAGKLDFAPSTISVGGQSLSVAQLQADPLLGSLASALLRQQSFCVAQYLPKALTADAVQISGGSLIVSFTGDGAALGGTDFTTKGSCA